MPNNKTMQQQVDDACASVNTLYTHASQLQVATARMRRQSQDSSRRIRDLVATLKELDPAATLARARAFAEILDDPRGFEARQRAAQPAAARAS